MSYGWLVLSACLRRLNSDYIVSLFHAMYGQVVTRPFPDSPIFWRNRNVASSALLRFNDFSQSINVTEIETVLWLIIISLNELYV